MSGSWQAFLENLSDEDIGTGSRNEICDCKDGQCQLFHDSSESESSFLAEGSCDTSKLCAVIMKDKYMAKIDSNKFQRYQEKGTGNQTTSSAAPLPGTGTELPPASKKKKEQLKFKALTSFF